MLCTFPPTPTPHLDPILSKKNPKLTYDTDQNEQQRTEITTQKYLRLIIRGSSYTDISICMLMMGSYWHIQQRTLYKLHDKGKGKVIPLQARCGPEGG